MPDPAVIVDFPIGGLNTGRQAFFRSDIKELIQHPGCQDLLALDDAALDTVIPSVARAAFFNQGQICLSGSRIFIAARLINLQTVSWLLENFLGSFLLILIILFQIITD